MAMVPVADYAMTQAAQDRPLSQYVTRRISPLPDDLVTADRICWRWAVSVGTGLPTDLWLELLSKPPPLDDDTAIVVDKIILKSPPKTKRVIVKWYRTQLPPEVVEDDIGLLPGSLPNAHQICLNYLQWKFVESDFPPLLALLRFRE